MAYLKIGGLNVLPYLESGGISWGLETVTGKSVTTLDGKEHVDILARKRTLQLTFPDLADQFAQLLLQSAQAKVIRVTTDIDPLSGYAEYIMHNDSRSANCSFIYDSGLVKWSGLEFDLKEY